MFTINLFKQNKFPVDMLIYAVLLSMIKVIKCWDFKVLLQIALFKIVFVCNWPS